jgi:hypothetical protein
MNAAYTGESLHGQKRHRDPLKPDEILRNCHRPLYYLVVISQPIRNGNYRPTVAAKGYAQIQVTPRGRIRRGASPIAAVYVEGQGEWNNDADGSGEREGQFLYLFLHRTDAEFFLQMNENRNKAAANAIAHVVGEDLGNIQGRTRS